ncbi:hypothetical protein Q5H93_00690 [Hymenobacter sp. ASUV-10]|uniref:Uncharacterized protein n=1 Tax=Hymenobacter aranciens TaxID=3063996 RepID=A0ABT9B4T7_9BACT|nr:hypothetical protein [Hymenobacter sp. ASUV-10]MDO7873230.1 hypothetical protein [Hymenobacter sp. ASUV-10]
MIPLAVFLKPMKHLYIFFFFLGLTLSSYGQAPTVANVRKQLLDSLRKEAARKADAQADEAHIGTIALISGPRYTVYTNVANNKVVKDTLFSLEEMKFHLENGQLLRVYAIGNLLKDSLYKQSTPDPAVVKQARENSRAARQARAEADVAALAAANAQTKLQSGAKLTKAQIAALTQERNNLLEEVRAKIALAVGAEKKVSALAKEDTVISNLPANAPDGPRVSTRHAYITIRPIRFTNGKVAIDLNKAPQDGIDVLVPDERPSSKNRSYGLSFSDLVSVEHASGRRFVTNNESWILTPTKAPSHRLTASASLSGLLDVALYTDLLAALNNEDNSLVTTEISSLLPLNQQPLFPNSNFRLFTAARPFVTLARLDSRFDTLRLQRDSIIDRPNLLQRSYLRFGLNANLLTFDNRRHVSYHLNASWTRTISRVAGNMGLDTAQERNTYQNLYGLEFLMTVRRQRNFGADLYFTAYLHNVQSRRYIENNGAEWALRPGALFYYHPFGSPNNKLFFRVSNFIFPKGRQRDFVQLQVGYSIGLGSLFQPQNNSDDTGASGAGATTHLLSPQ